NYYPYFLQTECLVLRSPAILDLAARKLKTTNRNASVPIDNATEATSPKVLRSRLRLLPVPTTSVIEIQATDSQPAQAATLANAVAAAYKEYRLQQRRNSVHASLDALEARFSDQLEQIRKSEQLVDRLRSELRLPDAVVSENMPTVLLSADTLR